MRPGGRGAGNFLGLGAGYELRSKLCTLALYPPVVTGLRLSVGNMDSRHRAPQTGSCCLLSWRKVMLAP